MSTGKTKFFGRELRFLFPDCEVCRSIYLSCRFGGVKVLQQRRLLPVAETRRSCWGRNPTCKCRWSGFLRQASGDVKSLLFLIPPSANAKKKGGMPLFGKSVSVDCLMLLLDNTLKKSYTMITKGTATSGQPFWFWFSFCSKKTVTCRGGGFYFLTLIVNVNPNRWNVKVIGILSPPSGSEGQPPAVCAVPFSRFSAAK